METAETTVSREGLPEETVHVEMRGDLRIAVMVDTDTISPDDYADSGLFLVHYHHDCWIESESCPERLARRWYETQQGGDELDEDEDSDLVELMESYHVFPVAAYIHSGVVLRLGDGRGFPDYNWDVSHVGLVCAAKSEWSKREEAESAAAGLVQSWNDYLSGNIYGYTVERPVKCPRCGDVEYEHVDSCWGFYGDWEADYGALSEARAAADAESGKGAQ